MAFLNHVTDCRLSGHSQLLAWPVRGILPVQRAGLFSCTVSTSPINTGGVADWLQGAIQEQPAVFAPHDIGYSSPPNSFFRADRHGEVYRVSSANPFPSGLTKRGLGRMANSQHVGGKQRHRPQRHPRSPSPPGLDDWEGRQDPVVDSLPYRARNRDIQRPDSRKPKHNSSSHRRRASEDMRVRESIPPPTLTRSATVTHRSGKDPVAYDSNTDVYYERRPRMRHRSRSTSSEGSSSDSRSSTGSESELTPRSAPVNRSTPDSRRSSRSSSSRRTPSVDSYSSISTHDDLKEPMRRQPRDEIRPIPASGRADNRNHRRRHREKENIIYEVESTHKPKPAVPPAPVGEPNGAPHRRHAHRSDSRSGSHRRHHHHHRDHRQEVRPSSSSKRYVDVRLPWLGSTILTNGK